MRSRKTIDAPWLGAFVITIICCVGFFPVAVEYAILCSWLAPTVLALYLLKTRSYLDPRLYCLGGISFWCFRDAGGAFIGEYPPYISHYFAFIFCFLNIFCAAVVFFLLPPVETHVIRSRRKAGSQLTQAAFFSISLAAAVAYMAVPPSQYQLPIYSILLGIVSGMLLWAPPKRGALFSLPFVVMAIYGALNSSNRTTLLIIPAVTIVTLLVRMYLAGKAPKILSVRNVLIGTIMGLVLIPASVSTKSGYAGNYNGLIDLYVKFYSGEFYFPYFTPPQDYFYYMQRYISYDYYSSIFQQIVLSPLPRQLAPSKPVDIIHQLFYDGVGPQLYIENYLIALADSGVFGAVVYTVLPALLARFAVFLINSVYLGNVYRRILMGFYAILLYSTFMIQQGYPFGIAQYQLLPLSLIVAIWLSTKFVSVFAQNRDRGYPKSLTPTFDRGE